MAAPFFRILRFIAHFYHGINSMLVISDLFPYSCKAFCVTFQYLCINIWSHLYFPFILVPMNNNGFIVVIYGHRIYLSLFQFNAIVLRFAQVLSRNWFLKCPTWPVWEFPLTPFIAPFFKGGGCLSGDHVFKTVSLFEQFPTISVRLSGIDFVYISSNFHNWRHFFRFWLNSSGATPIVFPISQCKTNGFGCPCFIRHFVFITPHFMLNILAFYGSAAIVWIVVL